MLFEGFYVDNVDFGNQNLIFTIWDKTKPGEESTILNTFLFQ